MLTFRVLSALLSYPTPEVRAATKEGVRILGEEALLSRDQIAAVCGFADWLLDTPQLDAESAYIEAFDRGRSTSLYMFEHIHGESRERGQAMHKLLLRYRGHGLELQASELPDFLPLFLEFLSMLPTEEARKHLGQIDHIRSALGERLRKRQAPYETLFRAIGELAVVPKDIEAVSSALPDEDPNDLAALDAQWVDEPVTFGPESAPSCKDQLIAKIRAARRPVPGVAG